MHVYNNAMLEESTKLEWVIKILEMTISIKFFVFLAILLYF